MTGPESREARSTVAPAAPPRPTGRDRDRGRRIGLLVALLALAVVVLLSLAVGSRSLAPDTVFRALVGGGGDDGIVGGLRLPRTVVGLAVGAALGLAGALMQGLTRNPIAEPGLLGVNAGAAVAVVLAIAFLGVGTAAGYVGFALAGAGVAAVAVYALGSRGGSATPVRLALAGAAVTAALTAVITGVTLANPEAFDDYRFWRIGSLVIGSPYSVLAVTGPLLLVGAVLALALSRSLNALALGDDTGRALGARPRRTRVVGILAITLLAGAATATAGPLTFVGLAAPHAARAIAGPDQRWILPYSGLLAAILLVGADVLGRVVAMPGEIEVGIVTAFLGAPVFIWLVRRGRVARR